MSSVSVAMNSMTNKRKSISLETKLNIISDVKNKLKYDEIVAKYGLKSKSTISDILKNKGKLETKAFNSSKKGLKALKRNRSSAYKDIEKALLIWITEKRSQNAPINTAIIKTKAKDFAKELKIENYKPSNGFVTRFVKRHNIKFETKCGESESVPEEVVERWKSNLKDKYNNYDKKDVWNIDETGVFWRLCQNKTYSLPNESSKGMKKNKERVTVLLLVNADGSERLLVVIGKSRQPRCFKGIKNFPIWLYLYNKNAWMTSQLFDQIMQKLNKRMEKQNRKILVILDNCSAHPEVKLNSINFLFLPPNTTSRLQPLDAGIIRSFKQRYRNKMLELIVQTIDSNIAYDCATALKTITLLKAIYMFSESVREINESVFINCFRICGFVFEQIEPESEDLTEEIVQNFDWNELNQRLELNFNDFNGFSSFDDNIICRQDMSDKEIIEIVKPDEITVESSDTETEDIDSNVVPVIPSKTEALKCVNDLRLYLGSLEEIDNNYYDFLNKFENLILRNKSTKQALITNYFTTNN
jgi:hypothetical protein